MRNNACGTNDGGHGGTQGRPARLVEDLQRHRGSRGRSRNGARDIFPGYFLSPMNRKDIKSSKETKYPQLYLF
jgi:hypothetical protein